MLSVIMNRLASIRLAWWSLIGLAGWFWVGMAAANRQFFADGLWTLNTVIVRDWVLNQGLDRPWVLGWLTGLIFWAALLGLNLAACLWQRLTWPGNRGLRFWVFVSLHLLFGLVMGLHGLEMVTGDKYPVRTVQAGETISLDSKHTLQVQAVTYVNQTRLLKLDKQQARQAMTRDRFDLQANSVRVSLMANGEPVRSGRISMLSPLSFDDLHIILRGFGYGPHGVTAKIRVVRSPLHTLFLTAYTLLILSLIAWCILQVRE